MSLETARGTIIEGKYRLERELGAGGMGAVWLATQLMIDRNVAVKLLHPAFVDQEDLQARFEVEAKAIGRLNHPNCITLFDFGFSKDLGAFYTVIEYIKGESLDKRLGTSMPITETVSILRQIAMALGHAHHQGILHRDLKPENVMLAEMTDGSEIAKVLDFGIARIVRGDQSSQENHRITKAGEVFGTPAYMSPEQARSIRELTAATDLYAVGVMFYELVVGRLPFFAESSFDILMMQVTKPVPVITREGVPDDVKAVIYKLLEKEPEKRYQSCQEFIAALDALDLSETRSAFEETENELAPKHLTSGEREPMGSVPTLMTGPQRAVGTNEETLESDRPQLDTITPARPWGILAGMAAAVLVVSILLFMVFGGDETKSSIESSHDAPPEIETPHVVPAQPEIEISAVEPIDDEPEVLPEFEDDGTAKQDDKTDIEPVAIEETTKKAVEETTKKRRKKNPRSSKKARTTKNKQPEPKTKSVTKNKSPTKLNLGKTPPKEPKKTPVELKL